MGEFLTKDEVLFERDEQGKLVSQVIVLETLPNKPKIKALPIPRGEFQRMYAEAKGEETNTKQDESIITEHCIEPKFTKEEIKAMRPIMASAIVTGIIALSLGTSQKEVQDITTKKALEISEEMLKKK